jgi:DNA polymerase/3'-5' exonuclease PolX
MTNAKIAKILQQHAHKLSIPVSEILSLKEGVEKRVVSLYRIRAYRRAAFVITGLERPVVDLIAEQGRAGLEVLPGIGRKLAEVIERYVQLSHGKTTIQKLPGKTRLRDVALAS